MRKKKKLIIKAIAPKPRNPVARLLCTAPQFKTQAFKNKKKAIERFDWRKEDFKAS